MRVMIIGGTRFLGRAIVDGLLARHHEVIVAHRGRTPLRAKGVTEALVDKGDRKAFGDLLSGVRCDAVIDTILSADDLRFAIPILRGRIKHFIHCGSTGVYTPMKYIPAKEDDPCNPPPELGGFGTKLEQDNVLMDAYREHDFPATCLRPTNIYGPGDVPLDIWGGRDPNLHRRIARGDEIIVPNDGRALLQPGYVEELGEAFCLALGNEESLGEIYNISSERCVTLNEYLRMMMEIVGSSSHVTHMPMEELIATHRDYFKWPAGLKFVCEHMCVDIHKAMDQLGFSPEIPLDEGLRRNFEWMRDEGIVRY